MFLEILQNSSLVENLAWTLLHSVWQIGFMAFCLFLSLRFIAKSNANLRYFVSVSALSLALLLPIATFISQFSFQTNNQQIISVKTSKQIQRKQLENSEEYSLTGKLVSDTTNTKTTSSASIWQNSLSTTFSTHSSFLVAFWLIGILLFSLRFIGGFWQLHLYKTRQVSELNFDWQVRFAELCGKLNVNQCVEILQSNLVTSPMVIGWLKPVILVPASVFLQMDIRQLETIIAHELLHIKRFDFLINFAQSFVEILFFYHPCIWWISTKIRQERECACDDAVLQILENAQFTYANALANLESFRSMAKHNEPQILVAANGGKLMNRIERIVKKETKNKNRFQNSLWSASLASMLILAFFATIFWASGSLNVKQKLGLISMNKKKIAIGFKITSSDGILENNKNPTEITAILIEKLKREQIPAVGFVEGSKYYNKNFDGSADDFYKLLPSQIDSIKTWRDAGLELGIGSYNDLKFNDTVFEDYVADAKKNIELIKPILSESNQELRYFNYHFLRTGKDFESKVQFEQWLTEQNLRSVPFTFANPYIFTSSSYSMGDILGDSKIKDVVKQEFLEYMEKLIVHYEDYSKDIFGREIPQTLIFPSNDLIIDSADELFAMFRKHGYEFVSLEDALSDEVYNQPETYSNYEGGSWFERQAVAKGKTVRKKPEFERPKYFELMRVALNKQIKEMKKTNKNSLSKPLNAPTPLPTPPKPPVAPPPAPPKPPPPPKPSGK